MSFNLSTLNDEQIKPVLDTEGAVLVTAGAGSGKTRLLTHRIAHLIIDNHISPYNILAITFTNKAASEMRERLEQMIPESRGLWVSTFHSMCAVILRKFIHKLGYTTNFSIYGENEKERTIKKLIKEEKVEDDITKSVINAISNAKSNGETPEEYYQSHKYSDNSEIIRAVYEKYEIELKNNNSLDFDDLLNKTYELISKDSEVAEYYSEKFHYIHVDEFQDTNTIQYKLVRCLAKKHRNIFVVGDEDQSIYGWRGANISNIFDFTKDFDCKIYKLEQNYRSTKKILNLANTLIENNSSRMKKILWTENNDGNEIETFVGANETKEAEFVVSKIYSLMQSEHYQYSDFAILMRINALSRAFEEKLIQYGLPHKIFGGFKFYERKEIKDVLAYLRIIVNPFDNDAIMRVINFPKRGIGDAAIGQLTNYCLLQHQSFFDTVINIENNLDLALPIIKKVAPFATVLKCLLNEKENIKLSDLVKYLIKLLNLKEVFAEDNSENESRKQNIKELVGSIEQYENLNPNASLEEYLQNVSLYSDLDDVQEDAGAVNIATIHSAKGLEFKVVFVVGLEDGIFPMSRCMESNAEMEEERRLMYVAITRAEERLHLSFSSTRFLYKDRKISIPSRFLAEIGYTMSDILPKNREEYGYRSAYSSNSSYRGGYNNYNKSSSKESSVTVNPIKPIPIATRNPNIQVNDYHVGVKVKHKKFGEGVVVSITNEFENTYAEIVFDTVGKLVLALSYAPLEIID